jgi:hypothetical protein
MKALIWVSDQQTRLLTQIMDRPYVQHLLEQLVRRNIDTLIFYLHYPDPRLRELLGDGTRWGVEIQIHEAGSIPVNELCDSSRASLAFFLRCILASSIAPIQA